MSSNYPGHRWGPPPNNSPRCATRRQGHPHPPPRVPPPPSFRLLSRSPPPQGSKNLRITPRKMASTPIRHLRPLFLFFLVASLRCGNGAETLTRASPLSAATVGVSARLLAPASLISWSVAWSGCRSGGWRRWRGLLLGGAVERVLRGATTLLEGHPPHPRARAPPRCVSKSSGICFCFACCLEALSLNL